MQPGYLTVETHAGHAGLSRLKLRREQPDPDPTGHEQPRIRYVAQFNDGDAALMHTHEILKRRLLDPDTHLYRIAPERAVAAVESLGLRHRRVYLDPDFPEQSRTTIAQFTARFARQRERRERFFQTLGYIGIALLLFNLVALSLA